MVSAAEQGRASKESVLVIPAPDRAAILVSGKDRTSWLNGLVTADLAKLGPAQASYSLLVEKKGRIQTDMAIVPGPSALALAVPRSLREPVMATLDHYLVMEDAELTTSELDFFFAHGPRAKDLAAIAPWFGALDLLGSGGAVFAIASAERGAFDATLAAELAKIAGVAGDESAWEAIRIEHGLPRFGVEYDATAYPQEASLEKLAVSFDKGCYLGQEVVYMLENRGHVKSKLVPIAIEGEGVIEKGSPITTPDGAAVGEVKSSAIGPFSQAPVAIASVKWAQSKPGTELRAGGRVARVKASDRA
jgi:folate-binding protein YgfZ